jgi:hypothetical protein
LILFGDDGVDDCTAPGSLCLQLGEKYIADGVSTGGGELGIEVQFCNLLEETVGQGHQYAGAVTGVGFESTAATVAHAGINMMGIQHDLVTGLPLNIGD